MKKILLSVVTIGTFIGVSITPVFANVVHTNGSSGKPTMVYSNPGSSQGQLSRSSTGTTNKTTHDGWAMME